MSHVVAFKVKPIAHSFEHILAPAALLNRPQVDECFLDNLQKPAENLFEWQQEGLVSMTVQLVLFCDRSSEAEPQRQMVSHRRKSSADTPHLLTQNDSKSLVLNKHCINYCFWFHCVSVREKRCECKVLVTRHRGFI